MKDAYEHRYIKTNAINLHIVQAGPQEGPLLILLHGFPEFWYGWRHQIEPLAQAGFRVIVPDQRGYNLSDKPKGIASYSTDKLAADVIGLINVLGHEKAYLAGHDWGAAVAWQTAITYPQRLEKLAILNVPHLDVMTHFLLRNFTQFRKSWYIYFFQVPGLPEWLLRRNDCANARRMLLTSSKPGSFNQADLAEYVKAWSQPGALTSMVNWYRAALHHGFHSSRNPRKVAPRRVQVPTLILWGKNDIALSHEMAQPSLGLCDNGQLVFFENATHWVQHDEAQAVTQNLIRFFQGSLII